MIYFPFSAVPSSVLMSMLNQLNVTKEIPYLDYYLKVIQQAAEIGIPEDVRVALFATVYHLCLRHSVKILYIFVACSVYSRFS